MKTASKLEDHLLVPAEIRMIADGRTERLAEFAASSRLYAVDPKGNTPLHIAARMGNLVACDLFIRSGADPRLQNHDRQTPADVAYAEGYRLAAELLLSLAENSQIKTLREALADVHRVGVEIEKQRIVPLPSTESASTEAPDDQIELANQLYFEPEEEPEQFFNRSAGDSALGTFVALVGRSTTDSNEEDVDWEVDLSSAQIAGEGIGSDAAITPDHHGEHDFLKVRNRGRRSVKRAVVQSGTRLFIDPEICWTWAAEILEKRWFSSDDMDRLISFCEGNGDPDELRVNLLRTFEAAGLELFDGANENGNVLWDIRSGLSVADLAEGNKTARIIWAVLTRNEPYKVRTV